MRSGEAVGDRLWRMPLSEGYETGITSRVADLRHCASPGLAPDACHAARFLGHFAGAFETAPAEADETTEWAHIDIAGVASRAAPTDLGPKGATGFGVRLLDRYAVDYCERRRGR